MEYFLKKGASLTFVLSYVDYLVENRLKDETPITTVDHQVKTLFDTMLSNGDIEYSDWDAVKAKVKEGRYKSNESEIELLRQQILVETLTTITENCKDNKGRTFESSITMENLSTMSNENKIDRELVEVMALIKYKKEIEQEIDNKLNMMYKENIKREMINLSKKYKEVVPGSYTKMINNAFTPTI